MWYSFFIYSGKSPTGCVPPDRWSHVLKIHPYINNHFHMHKMHKPLLRYIRSNCVRRASKDWTSKKDNRSRYSRLVSPSVPLARVASHVRPFLGVLDVFLQHQTRQSYHIQEWIWRSRNRVGRGNLSIFLPSTARENFKLMTNGRLTVPIEQMALPLATPVAFLNELGNPGVV